VKDNTGGWRHCGSFLGTVVFLAITKAGHSHTFGLQMQPVSHGLAAASHRQRSPLTRASRDSKSQLPSSTSRAASRGLHAWLPAQQGEASWTPAMRLNGKLVFNRAIRSFSTMAVGMAQSPDTFAEPHAGARYPQGLQLLDNRWTH
jgi:2-methylcitrate dehydratase PrpD